MFLSSVRPDHIPAGLSPVTSVCSQEMDASAQSTERLPRGSKVTQEPGPAFGTPIS